MKKEIEANRSSLTAYDLVKTRGMRRISICLIVVWSDDMPSSHTSHLFFFYLLHTMRTQDKNTTKISHLRFFFLLTWHNSLASTCHKQLSVSSHRFATSFAYYGLAMDLQKFGVSQQSTYGATCWQWAEYPQVSQKVWGSQSFVRLRSCLCETSIYLSIYLSYGLVL